MDGGRPQSAHAATDPTTSTTGPRSRDGHAESVRRSDAVKRSGWTNRFFLLLALVVGITIAGLPFSGWVAWMVAPDRPLDLLVYDSTVFTDERRQHNAVGLMMTYLKVPFDGDVDYVGTEPGGLPFGAWPETQPELVLLVDAYGVYVNDEADIDENGEILISDTFPERFADDVAEWGSAGSIMMAEFNMMHEPTDAATSEILQDVFGIDATGWTGRAFEDLQDASDRLKELHYREWDYEGPGIILVGASAGDRAVDPVVEVLLPEHLGADAPRITGDVLNRGREIDISYFSWFALISADVSADTELWLELPVNDRGAALLEERGVPQRSPFLVWTDNTVYAAGNVATTPAAFPARRIRGALPVLERIPASASAQMFYLVYAPLLERLVEMAEQTNIESN